MNIIKNRLLKIQIKNNAIVVFVLDIIFFVVLCFFKKYDLSVILSLILGSSYSILNFIFIAIGTEKLVLISDQQDKNKIKNKAIFYYYIRYCLKAIVIIIAIKINKINNFVFLVSLFFSKIAIFFQGFLEDYK